MTPLQANWARAYLPRGVLLWLAVRAVISCMLIAAKQPVLQPSFLGALTIVPCCFVAGWLDIGRRKEQVLLGNLGLSRTTVAGLLAAPAAAGELALALAGRIG